MKRIMLVPALLALCAQPALAGDWDEYSTYEYYSYEAGPGGVKDYDVTPAYREPYVSSGVVVTDEAPHSYGSNCEVEREWSPGHYREPVECEEE